MSLFAKLGVYFLAIIFIILSFTGLASFSLEVAKIALFNQSNGELKLHPMDYVYLTALALGMSGLYCCHATTNEQNNNHQYGISGTLISLVIMILYTIFTKEEMGDIPFFCPANYHYSSYLIRTACQVRAANLLIMWISPSMAIFMIIIALAISYSCRCGNKNNDCIV